MKISIIVAMDEKRGIGKNNGLMWHIPGELPRFKNLTTDHSVIMGRKTFESIGKPLPNRTNIIVTQNPTFKAENCTLANSIDEAIEIAKTEPGSDEIFIIGGGQIYTQALAKADRLYLTLVEGDFGADTFFPDYSMFRKVISEESYESGGYKYRLLTLEK